MIRRIVRGPRQPGGHERTFLNLCAGLDRVGVGYEVNNFGRHRNGSGGVACVIGQPHILDSFDRHTPIVFGPAGYSHPVDAPQLIEEKNILAVLVPSDWVRSMFSLAWGEKVHVWPVGIDTDAWRPEASVSKDVDVLVYDKIRWRRDRLVPDLLERIRARLRSMGLAHEVLRYGSYREADFKALVHRSRSMVYLCEHETQGIALQQVLSCNVPVLVWDRRGCWQDPAYFPDRVRFQPVTTVPYWDERCGSTFADFGEFEDRIDAFWSAARCGSFAGRSYILQNLTLDKAATNYVDIIRRIAACRQEA